VTAIFVTATGTDIGKTFVTTGLIRIFRARGRPVSVLKPVISGFDPDAAETSDTGVLLQAMGRPVTPQAVADVSPWRFRAPLSPDMAAAREGRTIDFPELITFCRNAISAAPDMLFIEGVGGVMVPLDSRHTVLDLIAALDIPAILVTGTYLGTISHTLTALNALVSRRVAVCALVLNESEDAPTGTHDTTITLARFVRAIPIAIVPRAKQIVNLDGAFDDLCDCLAAPHSPSDTR
jgi:dethiobiotin synthetase